MPDNRNLILAVVISIAILMGFHYVYEVPRQQRLEAIQAQEQVERDSQQVTGKGDTPAAELSVATAASVEDRDAALAKTSRRPLDNPRVTGSLSLSGGRFDDLTFKDYFTDLSHTAQVDLLSPSGTASPYYASFGFIADDPALALPDDKTVWKSNGDTLTPDHPVTFTWDNGAGLTFARTVALDANYMFTITSHVANHGAAAVTLYPYALVARQGVPTPGGTGLEGAIAVAGGTLKDASFMRMTREPGWFGKLLGHTKFQDQKYSTKGGWAGFSDKYWLVAVVPDQKQQITINFHYSQENGLDRFQTDYRGEAQTIAPGASIDVTSRLFAGAKEVPLLRAYRDQLGIPKLDLAVDWWVLPFLTKPFFYCIDFLAHLFGNFGLGILAFTVVVRIVIFPLAYKTYREMSRMKDLTPQMNEIKDKYVTHKVTMPEEIVGRQRGNPYPGAGANKAQMQAEIMELYKREKVNPLSGCLPTLIQIPIFLALFRVLSTTIEMRQAPFYGWIHDLSAADPTNVFTLFGLIPFTLPLLPHLGAWPLLLGGTMLALQRAMPQPPDPVQARMQMLTPLIFMFIMAKLPAGLVIYYSWSNLISIGQQWAIRRAYHKKYRPA